MLILLQKQKDKNIVGGKETNSVNDNDNDNDSDSDNDSEKSSKNRRKNQEYAMVI